MPSKQEKPDNLKGSPSISRKKNVHMDQLSKEEQPKEIEGSFLGFIADLVFTLFLLLAPVILLAVVHLDHGPLAQFLRAFKGKQLEKVYFGCIGIAFSLIFISNFPSLLLRVFQGKLLAQNSHPRAAQEYLKTGIHARIRAGHLNALEAFPGFAAGVIVAHLMEVQPLLIAKLSVVFIAGRLAYHVFYILNISFLRSLMWLMCHLACGALYLLPFFPQLFKAPPEFDHMLETLLGKL